ncbi:hypothetical protein PAENIP36_51960 [Paenibacillus sp. P36]
MKKSITLTSRVLAAVMIATSLFAAGIAPAQPAYAQPDATNVFATAGVTVSANGYVSDQAAPAHAIDGNPTSNWVYKGDTNPPSQENPYWLKVDAGAEATVHQFVLAHAGYSGAPDIYNTRDYTIETSEDDVHWNPVVSVTNNTYGLTTHNLSSPVTARYFKLNITDPGSADLTTGEYSANIYEFQAFGFVETKPLVPVVTPLASGSNQGLLGEYYLGNSDFSFGAYKATTVDPQINFTNLDPVLQSWTGQQDHANVRWTGQIMPPQSGDYTFYMMGDNGFRLWVMIRL